MNNFSTCICKYNSDDKVHILAHNLKTYKHIYICFNPLDRQKRMKTEGRYNHTYLGQNMLLKSTLSQGIHTCMILHQKRNFMGIFFAHRRTHNFDDQIFSSITISFLAHKWTALFRKPFTFKTLFFLTNTLTVFIKCFPIVTTFYLQMHEQGSSENYLFSGYYISPQNTITIFMAKSFSHNSFLHRHTHNGLQRIHTLFILTNTGTSLLIPYPHFPH